jgi:hypothetical protein
MRLMLKRAQKQYHIGVDNTCAHGGVYIHTHTHTHAHMHTCTHAHMHTCIHTCTSAHICTNAHMHTYAHMHTQIHIQIIKKSVDKCLVLCAYIHTSMYSYMYARVYALSWFSAIGLIEKIIEELSQPPLVENLIHLVSQLMPACAAFCDRATNDSCVPDSREG